MSLPYKPVFYVLAYYAGFSHSAVLDCVFAASQDPKYQLLPVLKNVQTSGTSWIIRDTGSCIFCLILA